ncbi:MAG TPA: hypothetical protein VF619_06965 [Allosphingosinicella sp.]|jgi:hypothetical protein
MLRLAFLIFLAFLLQPTAAAGAAERSPAGIYRLVGEQDVASELILKRGGRLEYFLAAGALDERAEGRWSATGETITLSTEPRPVPPLFERGASSRTDGAALAVKVSSPAGSGIAGVDLRVGFDAGEPVEDYTQEDGWSLPVGDKRVPRWIELSVPMHGVSSPRFPIDLAAGNALAFTLVPNDLGVVDFTGVKVEIAGKALIVHRGAARLRYERVRK